MTSPIPGTPTLTLLVRQKLYSSHVFLPLSLAFLGVGCKGHRRASHLVVSAAGAACFSHQSDRQWTKLHRHPANEAHTLPETPRIAPSGPASPSRVDQTILKSLFRISCPRPAGAWS